MSEREQSGFGDCHYQITTQHALLGGSLTLKMKKLLCLSRCLSVITLVSDQLIIIRAEWGEKATVSKYHFVLISGRTCRIFGVIIEVVEGNIETCWSTATKIVFDRTSKHWDRQSHLLWDKEVGVRLTRSSKMGLPYEREA